MASHKQRNFLWWQGTMRWVLFLDASCTSHPKIPIIYNSISCLIYISFMRRLLDSPSSCLVYQCYYFSDWIHSMGSHILMNFSSGIPQPFCSFYKHYYFHCSLTLIILENSFAFSTILLYFHCNDINIFVRLLCTFSISIFAMSHILVFQPSF